MYVVQDLHAALKMLGLNPLEQEILDLTNEIAREGFVFFPEFCQVVLRKFREEDEELFRMTMFKVKWIKADPHLITELEMKEISFFSCFVGQSPILTISKPRSTNFTSISSLKKTSSKL